MVLKIVPFLFVFDFVLFGPNWAILGLVCLAIVGLGSGLASFIGPTDIRYLSSLKHSKV